MLLADFRHAHYLTNEILWNVEQNQIIFGYAENQKQKKNSSKYSHNYKFFSNFLERFRCFGDPNNIYYCPQET